MGNVTIRDLRNHGGAVIDRVQSGEQVTITRGGKPVAELRRAPSEGTSSVALVARWRSLPPIDPVALRHDIDQVIDPTL